MACVWQGSMEMAAEASKKGIFSCNVKYENFVKEKGPYGRRILEAIDYAAIPDVSSFETDEVKKVFDKDAHAGGIVEGGRNYNSETIVEKVPSSYRRSGILKLLDKGAVVKSPDIILDNTIV